ncbi:MAG TPA: hypothetical protein PLB26_00625 [Rubrivivax sp.]|nr:hypothetical protein [Rubrivivax sp.]
MLEDVAARLAPRFADEYIAAARLKRLAPPSHAEAQAYGERAAYAWARKLDLKLGPIDGATFVLGLDGHLIVIGARAGRSVHLAQWPVVRVSPKGKPFHQFQSRLHVDGGFVSEADYRKLFTQA